MVAIVAQHSAEASAILSLVNATASASNTAAQSGGSPFDAILQALGLGSAANTSPAIPSSIPQNTASAGVKLPSGKTASTAGSQKPLANTTIDSLKVLTQAQAAQLAAQAQATQAPPAQAALSASLAANPQPTSNSASVLSSVGNVVDAIGGVIKSGLTAAEKAVGVGGSSPSPAPQPVAPVVAGPSAVAASKAQAQSTAATITQANAEALDVALGQASGAQSIASEVTQAASALTGARISAAKNPTADQLATSKQQAFADLKPAADVKATETQVLQPNAGADEADSKDNGAPGGEGGGAKGSPSGNSQTASATPTAPTTPSTPSPDPQQNFQPASAVMPDASTVSNIAGGAASAAGNGVANIHAPASTGIAVGPQSPAQSAMSAANPHALAVTIAAKSVEGAKQFDIRLDPPELGRVDVKLSVDNTGKAQAHLTVEKPQTLDMLQKDSGSLQRSLKDSGVDLANNGLQFSLKNQQQPTSTPTPAVQGRKLSVTAVPVVAQSTSTYSLAHDHARLDIRV